MLALERGDLAVARRNFEQALRARSAIVARACEPRGGGGQEWSRASAIEEWKRAVQLEPQNYDDSTTSAHAGRRRPSR